MQRIVRFLINRHAYCRRVLKQTVHMFTGLQAVTK